MSRKLCLLLFSFVLIALTAFAAGSVSAENLLLNADFSQLDENGLPYEWYTDAYILESGYTSFQISEGTAEHPVIASIHNIGDNDARFAQTVKVEPDSMYLLSGYICAENISGGHGANLSVEGVYAFSSELYDTAGEWQYIEYYGETGPDQDYITVFARVGGYSGVCTGTARFADLSLTKVDSVPEDIYPDLWYKMQDYAEDDEYEDEYEDNSTSSFRIYLFLIGLLYTAAACWILFRRTTKHNISEETKIRPVCVAVVLLLSLILRMFISYLVEGYMVDVNCFLSWGRTMASAGPAGFYEATSFCDYPPLYTYILALNSRASELLGGGTGISRIVFRVIPSLADLTGCWLIYRLLIKHGKTDQISFFLFLVFTAFHPTTILNSAAWGQMDSVLCLLLLIVSMSAVEGKWIVALPVYVAAVLVKPQALMLGPLGLTYIIITFIRDAKSRRNILYGTGIGIIVLFAGIIPFTGNQEWDWIIKLYSRTLSSYPYATVNTANLYYLLGGNWTPVENPAHILAPILFSLLCLTYGCWWYIKAKDRSGRLIETSVSIVFSILFVLCACLQISWTWCGTLAMVFAFVIVLGHAIRSRKISMLPWLGGLLYILLYVFGIKMHERYVFPAFLLLSAAWIIHRDRRILYILILFSLNVFLNAGIVLDNSITLGSSMGHLNSDTVFWADIISLLNVAGAIYAVWLSTELLIPHDNNSLPAASPGTLSEQHFDRKLYWSRKDTVLTITITVAFSIVSLLTLGSTKAPETCWTSSSPAEQVFFDLGEVHRNFEILYFSQVSRNDFSFSVSSDGETWNDDIWAQMDQGQCWKWKYVTDSYENDDGTRTYFNSDESRIIRFTGRYIRLTSHQLGLRLNEIMFRDISGNVIQASVIDRTGAEAESALYSDPAALLDEQDEMEGLPSFPETYETASAKTQPSWWNSTYFDEIYHARTAYEFLHGTVPYETSHPPLGKILMSLSVAIFGMNPFGWRFAGALAGILMLPGMYLVGKQLTKRTGTAVLSCLFMALDCMHLTQTQIATIDSFPVLFIIFAYFFMLRFIQTDFVTENLSSSLITLALSGLFMGLSIASKWIGIYAGAGLAVLFFWHCLRIIRLHGNMTEGKVKTSQEADDISGNSGSITDNIRIALKRTLVICSWCVLFFIIIPASIYLLSYIPYMAYISDRIHTFGEYVEKVWQAQLGMFNYHSTPNLGMDHPFYSPWWEWPVIGKPMYYASQQYIPADSPVHHSIFCFGNPVIWYGGLAALAICILRTLAARRYRIDGSDTVWHLKSRNNDPRYTFILVGILAQYLPWVLVPRGTYIYHYFASLPFLMCATALCFCGQRKKYHKAVCVAAVIFTVAAAVFFILLFPYSCGLNVSSEWLNTGRRFLHIWY